MAKRAASRARLSVPTVQASDTKVDRTKAALDRIDRVEKLDTSRPYGKVTGDYIVNGERIAFEQGQGRGKPSKLFNHERIRVYRDGEKPSPLPPKRREEPVSRQPAPPVDLDDEEEEMPPMVAAGETAADIIEPDDDGVNLVAWGERSANYRWALIREAIEARYGRVVNDEAEARDFLQEEGIGAGSGRKPVLGGE